MQTSCSITTPRRSSRPTSTQWTISTARCINVRPRDPLTERLFCVRVPERRAVVAGAKTTAERDPTLLKQGTAAATGGSASALVEATSITPPGRRRSPGNVGGGQPAGILKQPRAPEAPTQGSPPMMSSQQYLAPRNIYVNLGVLARRFSTVTDRFSGSWCRFPESWGQDGENGEKTGKKRAKMGQKWPKKSGGKLT